MKVLFAVSDESVSESIVKKYQQMYKEIIISKNVYYFNAIIKELQKDKTYDRVVVSEDLEPFANNNYEAIDNFIFEKLDNISDEAVTNTGDDTPIILITADRRTKSDNLLIKLFGIGVYSALIGQDRSIEEVCKLIQKPRSKKEAKAYYQVASNDVDYKPESEANVSETEIQNILAYYKKLGRNEDRYVESFDNIASQYTDQQLRVIIKFLPLNVKAVLEANSPRYQQLVSFGTEKIKTSSGSQSANKTKLNNNTSKAISNSGIKVSSLPSSEKKPTKPVIIPSVGAVKKPTKTEKNSKEVIEDINEEIVEEKLPKRKGRPKKVELEMKEKEEKLEEPILPNFEEDDDEIILPNFEEDNDEIVLPDLEDDDDEIVLPPMDDDEEEDEVVLPQIDDDEEDDEVVLPPMDEEEEEDEVVLPQEDDEEDDEAVLPQADEEEKEDEVVLPQEDNEEDEVILPQMDDEEDDEIVLPDLEDFGEIENNEEETSYEQPVEEPTYNEPEVDMQEPEIKEVEPELSTNFEFNNTENVENIETVENKEIENYHKEPSNIQGLLSQDKKIVAFTGTSKNGTSFLVNNIAAMLASQGIKTAILDVTKNKNAYYIYTKGEEQIRKVAFDSMQKLTQGIAEGIKVNSFLDVYTSLPGENADEGYEEEVLQTLIKNYSLVLLDCDFKTNNKYISEAQEIYLVQSMDVLTIQPLTAYLRDLKSKGILEQNKLKVIINKYVRINRNITEKAIIGGMAFYNDPAMSYMTELFNRETIPYTTVPFDNQVYVKYLEALVNCEISINGYPKDFINNLRKLSGMVYPLLGSNSTNSKMNNPKYNSYVAKGFSNDMNSTLDKMRNNY